MTQTTTRPGPTGQSAEPLAATMAAIRPGAAGDRAGLAPQTVPVPATGEREVLVRVMAAAVNRSDALAFRGILPGPFPRTLGRDFAGDVVRGPDHLLGRRVWGSGGGDLGIARDGSHAGYLATGIDTVSLIPERLTYLEAGASALAYFTAAEAIARAGGIRPGMTLVATGAAGGVGGAAASLARWYGAQVIRVVRNAVEPEMPHADGEWIVRSDLEDVRAAILRRTEGRGADLAVDAVGGALTIDVLGGLRVGGGLCLVSSPPAAPVAELDLLDFYRRELRLVGLHTGRLTARDSARVLTGLADGFERGVLLPAPVQRTYTMEEAHEAFLAAERGVRGRPVLLPSGGDAVGRG